MKGHDTDDTDDFNSNRIGIVHCFNTGEGSSGSSSSSSSSTSAQIVDSCETYESEKDDDAYFDAVYTVSILEGEEDTSRRRRLIVIQLWCAGYQH